MRNDMIEIRTYSVEETAELGKKLGSLLQKGDVICLGGDLGTGKTAFTGGIAATLGVDGYITSPTFTIVNEYKGRIPLYHFDVYRIADSEEMFEIGFEEYLEGGGVVVIEWAERISEVIPEEHIRVEIAKDLKSGLDTRAIRMWFHGERYSEYECRMKKEE
jgi:tRNA threonylcarbamoyladenosine biosynthesis protein TsaE